MDAPEYGGDGTRATRCAAVTRPLTGFPGHWAPMALAFHDGTAFGPNWRGAFIAFHGSWNRAPLPQEGFRVAFQPMRGGQLSGEFQTFATSTDGPTGLRAAGVAVAPDGSLYIAADRNAKIWRVFRRNPGAP